MTDTKEPGYIYTRISADYMLNVINSRMTSLESQHFDTVLSLRQQEEVFDRLDDQLQQNDVKAQIAAYRNQAATIEAQLDQLGVELKAIQDKIEAERTVVTEKIKKGTGK